MVKHFMECSVSIVMGQLAAGDGTVNHPIYSAVPHYNDDKLKRRPVMCQCVN